MEYNRQSIRLNNWDYGKGIYFVTIDVEDKLKLFWDVGAESHFCPDGNKKGKGGYGNEKGKGGYGNEKGEGGYGNPPVRREGRMKIAVIGSRRMSQYGRRVIEKLVPELIKNKIIIVTGDIQGCNRHVGEIAKDYIEIKVEQGNFEKFNHELALRADKLLIIEAGEKSGTILAAKEFLDLGKEVFCVPGRIDDLNSAGCNWLIQNGAIMWSREITALLTK